MCLISRIKLSQNQRDVLYSFCRFYELKKKKKKKGYKRLNLSLVEMREVTGLPNFFL